MQRAASAGVAMPPAAKFGTGSLPVSATPHQLVRRAQLLGLREALLGEQREPADAGRRRACGERLDHVAGAGLALRAHHRRALADPPQRLAEVAAPQTNGTLNANLSTWCASSAGVSTSLSSM